jgi:hypothetical protein
MIHELKIFLIKVTDIPVINMSVVAHWMFLPGCLAPFAVPKGGLRPWRPKKPQDTMHIQSYAAALHSGCSLPVT